MKKKFFGEKKIVFSYLSKLEIHHRDMKAQRSLEFKKTVFFSPFPFSLFGYKKCALLFLQIGNLPQRNGGAEKFRIQKKLLIFFHFNNFLCDINKLQKAN